MTVCAMTNMLVSTACHDSTCFGEGPHNANCSDMPGTVELVAVTAAGANSLEANMETNVPRSAAYTHEHHWRSHENPTLHAVSPWTDLPPACISLIQVLESLHKCRHRLCRRCSSAFGLFVSCLILCRCRHCCRLGGRLGGRPAGCCCGPGHRLGPACCLLLPCLVAHGWRRSVNCLILSDHAVFMLPYQGI